MSAPVWRAGLFLVSALEHAAYVLEELLLSHRLEIGPFEITTRRRATERGHNAFEIGREVGRSEGGMPPAPRPERVAVARRLSLA